MTILLTAANGRTGRAVLTGLAKTEITSRFIDSALSTCTSRFVYYSVMHPLRRAVRHHRLKLDAEEALIE